MSSLRWALQLWRPHAAWIAPLVILTVLNAFAVAAIPLATKHVFDLLADQVTASSLRYAILVLAGCGLARFLFYLALQNMRAWLNTCLEWSVRSRIFSHLVDLGPSFYGRYRTGDLITRLTNDIGDEKLAWFLCSGIFRALEAVCDLTIVAFAMTHLSVPLSLWCLLPLPVLFLAFIRVSSMLHGRYKAQQKAISAVSSQLESTLTGIRLVKAHGTEDERRSAFRRDVEARREVEIDATRAQVMMESLYGYSWQLTAATVLLVGGRMVIQGTLTLGDFVAFNGFALSLTFPMFDLGNFLMRGRQAMVCIDRLRELEGAPIMDTAPASPNLGGGVRDAEYDLRQVTYAYPSGGRAALSGVDLRVAPGRLVAVTGRVGEGKTTLLRLLLRLMDPQSGTVARSGRRLVEMPVGDVRRSVGYVPQDPVVLSGTILENVRFGREGISSDDVAWALRVAHLDVDAFSSGLDTEVGPRGTQLSGGQKQRLGLARALAGHPSVLLLDDCTAALDAATEASLWDALRAEMPGATIVLVTHRTAALEHADQIVVLGNGGQVLEAGSHAALMEKDGEYVRLFHLWKSKEDRPEMATA